jgi:hypothetical protein
MKYREATSIEYRIENHDNAQSWYYCIYYPVHRAYIGHTRESRISTTKYDKYSTG